MRRVVELLAAGLAVSLLVCLYQSWVVGRSGPQYSGPGEDRVLVMRAACRRHADRLELKPKFQYSRVERFSLGEKIIESVS